MAAEVDGDATQASSTFTRDAEREMSASINFAWLSSASPSVSRTSATPARFGRYAVLSQLGAGGMGLVYLAHDRELERYVAIKVVKARGGGANVCQERLLREAQAMARLTHPNVVTIYDVGVLDDAVFVVMERVEGGTLKEWLSRRRRTWPEIASPFIAAARGLAEVHAAGLVHRDFKPSNVLLGEDGSVKVADFGLVLDPNQKTQEWRDTDASGAGDISLREGPTSTGQLVGTRGYMSPEQLRGEAVDARSDVFSFCVALHEAVHGVLPFAGHSRSEYLAAIQGGARRSKKSSAPCRVEALIARGLAADPAARWQTMEELRRALEEPSSHWAWWVVVAAMVIAVGLGVILSQDEDSCPEREQHLSGLWDQERAAAVAAAMRPPAAGIGEEGIVRVVAAIDSFAGDYADMRVQTCASLRHNRLSGRELAEIDACLDERRAAFGALLDLFASEGESLAVEAVDLVERLPALAACQETARPPGEGRADPRYDAQHQGLLDALASLHVWIAAGQQEAAEAAVKELRAAIEAAKSPVLSARFDALEGLVLVARGDGERGRERLHSSLQTALRNDLSEQAARTAISLMRDGARGEAGALTAYDGIAEAMLERAELAGSELDLIRRYTFAESLIEVQSMSAAWPALRAVVDEVRVTPTVSSHLRFEVYQAAIGATLFLGEETFYDELVEEALSLTRESLGDSHPRTRSLLRTLAEAKMRVGELREAYELADEAVQVSRENNDQILARALWTRGIVHERLGEEGEELEDLRRAVAICEHKGRCTALARLEITNSVAVVLDQRGDYEEARALLTEALRGGVGEAPPALELGARLTLGDIELHAGDLSAARRIFAELETPLRTHFGENSFYARYATRSLALVDLQEGNLQAARTTLEALLDDSRSDTRDPWETAATRFALAQAIEAGASSAPEHRQAVNEAKRGARIYRELSPGFATELAEIEAWIGKAK